MQSRITKRLFRFGTPGTVLAFFLANNVRRERRMKRNHGKQGWIFAIVLLAGLVLRIGSAALAVDEFVAPNADHDHLAARWAVLSPLSQQLVEDRLRFEILHEGRADLQPLFERLQNIPAPRSTLSKNNLLKIPLRTGILEVRALLKKARGVVHECSMHRLHMTLDTYRIEVVPHPTVVGKAILTFSDGTPNSVEKHEGVVKSDGTTANILGDDGTTIQIQYQPNGEYRIKTNKIAVTITAKFID
jgi:hypothetical protein